MITLTQVYSLETILLVAALGLLVKHTLVDFVLQTAQQATNKGIYGHIDGLVHSAQQALGTAIVVMFLVTIYCGSTSHPLPIAFLAISGSIIADFAIHYHMDWFKSWNDRSKGYTPACKPYWVWLGIDQFVHMITYLGLISGWAWLLTSNLVGG